MKPHLNNAAFDAAYAFILENEGGFVDDPADRGGPTNHGITERSAAEYFGPAKDVRTLTYAEVREFYEAMLVRANLAAVSHINKLLFVILADTATLHGGTYAQGVLQRALNFHGASLHTDSVVGPKTVKALTKYVNVECGERHSCTLLVSAICSQREYSLIRLTQSNPEMKRFSLGWARRLRRCRELSYG